MNFKIGFIILIIVAFGLSMLSFLLVSASLAGVSDPIINGFKNTGTAAGYQALDTGAPERDFVSAWSDYINGFAAIFGAFFMILVIYGGWLWMTAQGKEEQIERAKKIIIGAVIGLGVIIGGRLIAELTINYLGEIFIGAPV